jgi:hypothetical protein
LLSRAYKDAAAECWAAGSSPLLLLLLLLLHTNVGSSSGSSSSDIPDSSNGIELLNMAALTALDCRPVTKEPSLLNV